MLMFERVLYTKYFSNKYRMSIKDWPPIPNLPLLSYFICLTLFLRQIYFICTFDNANKQVTCQASGSCFIRPFEY